mmetsp:Transcript_7474/g.21108  ORF Transcript_7474/g.21108 Transcript_7474/m.21108 type:complete len:80 (+) Transcript_7474:127-366(+)
MRSSVSEAISDEPEGLDGVNSEESESADPDDMEIEATDVHKAHRQAYQCDHQAKTSEVVPIITPIRKIISHLDSGGGHR